MRLRRLLCVVFLLLVSLLPAAAQRPGKRCSHLPRCRLGDEGSKPACARRTCVSTARTSGQPGPAQEAAPTQLLAPAVHAAPLPRALSLSARPSSASNFITGFLVS
ncbi:apelin receptor early endogenous ligand isoform X1 [Gallus gallus]|uniref:apelin receptor early endogenous ligand isoform X1 n=1 Tax=Gallus gallus TaxID=9031 RepID=UPI001F018216|nr:apelin receptor early endogenous ligand isoform X1 [Gallus gallus]